VSSPSQIAGPNPYLPLCKFSIAAYSRSMPRPIISAGAITICYRTLTSYQRSAVSVRPLSIVEELGYEGTLENT
jgi:hypothetical protein